MPDHLPGSRKFLCRGWLDTEQKSLASGRVGPFGCRGTPQRGRAVRLPLEFDGRWVDRLYPYPIGYRAP